MEWMVEFTVRNTLDESCSGSWGGQPEQTTECCALACTIWPEKAGDGTGHNFGRQLVYGQLFAIALG